AATELPIVATDVGGNREVVLDGRTGYLVPAKNSQALAEAVCRVSAMSEADRRAMGRAGRQHIVSRFDLERILDVWEDAYASLLPRAGSHRGNGQGACISRPAALRVLMVVESSAGGTGRHVLDLCQGLIERGCEVHLLYSEGRIS